MLLSCFVMWSDGSFRRWFLHDGVVRASIAQEFNGATSQYAIDANELLKRAESELEQYRSDLHGLSFTPTPTPSLTSPSPSLYHPAPSPVFSRMDSAASHAHAPSPSLLSGLHGISGLGPGAASPFPFSGGSSAAAMAMGPFGVHNRSLAPALPASGTPGTPTTPSFASPALHLAAASHAAAAASDSSSADHVGAHHHVHTSGRGHGESPSLLGEDDHDPLDVAIGDLAMGFGMDSMMGLGEARVQPMAMHSQSVVGQLVDPSFSSDFALPDPSHDEVTRTGSADTDGANPIDSFF